MFDPSTDPVMKLALAAEKCLRGLADAVGEFRAGYIRDSRTDKLIPTVAAVLPMKAVESSGVEWLTTGEAAEILGIDEQTLRVWRSRGRAGKARNSPTRRPPKCYRVGAKVRYKRTDIDAWLEINSTE